METAEDTESLYIDAATQQEENPLLPRSVIERDTLSPRPFIRKRPSFIPPSQVDNDLISIYKLSILEDQMRRAEECSITTGARAEFANRKAVYGAHVGDFSHV